MPDHFPRITKPKWKLILILLPVGFIVAFAATVRQQIFVITIDRKTEPLYESHLLWPWQQELTSPLRNYSQEYSVEWDSSLVSIFGLRTSPSWAGVSSKPIFEYATTP